MMLSSMMRGEGEGKMGRNLNLSQLKISSNTEVLSWLDIHV